MKRAVLYISLIAALPFLASCDKNEFNWGAGVGTPITFSANSYYENGPSTRTEYSNDFVGTNPTYERINWVADDLIRISATDGNSNASASYTIVGSSIAASGQNSNASVTLASGSSELQWMSDATHTFYAFYGNNAASSTGKTITATLPEAQNGTRVGSTNVYKPNMGYAYMWAAKSTAPTNEGVSLEFSPLMTAFEVTVGAQGTSTLNIKSFTLESTSTTISGSFKATINDNLQGYTLSDISGTKKITVSFGSAGVDVTNSNPATFTVFAIPQSTGLTNLKMTFTLADGSKTIALNYNGSPMTFAAGKKYKITNVYVPEPENWEYTIDIDEIKNIIAYGHDPVPVEKGLFFKVNSYKHSNLNPTPQKVDWTAEIISASHATVSQLTLGAMSGDGDGNNVTAAISGTTTSHTDGYDSGSATRAALASADPRGTATTPFDLSRHPVYGDIDGTTYNPTTANCYVISAPGVYKFPLVYGNALVNGSPNVKAYDPASAGVTYSAGYYLPTFLNVNDDPISSPYILSDLGLSASSCNAAIVWQDAKDILRDTQCSVGGTSASDAYIQFEIKAEDIQAGNIILALRNSSNKILWSWHIWVTPKNLTPAAVTLPSGAPTPATTYMMGYNLGWTDAQSAYTTSYDTRIWVVRLTQAESGNTKDVTIKQIGDVISVKDNVGSNPFYQWGRKDPMRPAASSNSFKTLYYGTGYSTTISYTEDPDVGTVESITPKPVPSSATVTVGHAIENPHYEYMNTSTSSWLGGPLEHATDAGLSGRPGNLWNANVSTMAQGAASSKTVYDPCPPGFCVPRSATFQGIAGQTTFTSANPYLYNSNGYFDVEDGTDGVKFDNAYGNVFLPFTGAIGMEKGNIYDVKSLGYYWTDSITGNDGEYRHKAKYCHLQILDSSTTLVRPHHEQYRGACYSIRPVLEQ